MSITLIRPKGLGLYRVVGNNHNTKELLCGGFHTIGNTLTVEYLAKIGHNIPTTLPFAQPMQVGNVFGHVGYDSNYEYFDFGFHASGPSTPISNFYSDTSVLAFNAFNGIADSSYHSFEIINQNGIFVNGLPTINTSAYFNSITNVPSSFTLQYSNLDNPVVTEVEYNDTPLVQASYEVVYDGDGSFEQKGDRVIEIDGRKMVKIVFNGLTRINIAYDKANKTFLTPTYLYDTYEVNRYIYLWFDETEYIP